MVSIDKFGHKEVSFIWTFPAYFLDFKMQLFIKLFYFVLFLVCRVSRPFTPSAVKLAEPGKPSTY